MREVTDKFIEAMIPILERESGMAWGPQSVGRIVRWTLKASGTQIVDAVQDLPETDPAPKRRLSAGTGKLGTKARAGAASGLYLDVGRQDKPQYKQICSVQPEGDNLYFLTVLFVDGTTRKHVWCGTNTYE